MKCKIMSSHRYTWCLVSNCTSTSTKTPKKLFIKLPDNIRMRNTWLKLARRDPKSLSSKSVLYLCEDHFDLENDMENYMEYKIMGSVKKIKMKPNCTPTRFECDPKRKRMLVPNSFRSIIKKHRKSRNKKTKSMLVDNRGGISSPHKPDTPSKPIKLEPGLDDAVDVRTHQDMGAASSLKKPLLVLSVSTNPTEVCSIGQIDKTNMGQTVNTVMNYNQDLDLKLAVKREPYCEEGTGNPCWEVPVEYVTPNSGTDQAKLEGPLSKTAGNLESESSEDQTTTRTKSNMTSKFYKSCAVPMCKNTSTKTPQKLFVYVPNVERIRRKWFRLARRSNPPMSRNCYFCEDHFDMPNDMENYMEYCLMGSVSQIRMRPNCLPKKFYCQPGRGKSLSFGRRKILMEKCMKESDQNAVVSRECKDSGSWSPEQSSSTAITISKSADNQAATSVESWETRLKKFNDICSRNQRIYIYNKIEKRPCMVKSNMNSKFFKTCAVPMCGSTSIKTPQKLFVYVPNEEGMRKKWFLLARRYTPLISGSCYFCEDHFDMPNDMENYMEYHIMGSVSQMRMRPNCLPSKFFCQPDRIHTSTEADVGGHDELVKAEMDSKELHIKEELDVEPTVLQRRVPPNPAMQATTEENTLIECERQLSR